MENQLNYAKHSKYFSFMKSRLLRSILCVFLTICLVFGTNVDLSFASELLPDTPQDVYISQLESQTLYASNDGKDTSSYQWQICVPNSDEYIPINNETSSSLEVDAALVKNALNNENIAKIQCLNLNSEGTEVASRLYIVHFDPSSDNFNQQLEDDAISSQLGNVTGETVYSNGESDENANLTVTVSYWTTKGQALGIENTKTFTKEDTLEWYLQVINLNGATLATTNPIQYDNKDALENVGFTSEIIEGSGMYYDTKGIYILHDRASGPIPSDINEINVRVYFDMADITYHVKAYYQDKNKDDEYHLQEANRAAPIGTAIPTIVSEGTYISDIDYFSTQFYEGDPEGWEAVNFHQQDLTIQDQTVMKTIELNFNRTYTICRFDPNGGVNGPSAIYMKHGDTFQNVDGWETEGGIKVPTPKPTRDAYTFDGWTDDEGKDVATWNMDIPGKDTFYHAKWKLALPEDSSINVTIAYYCEKADSPDFEYLIERYDRVPVSGFQEGVTTYTLPANASSTDPYKDRRFPQVRANSSDEYTLKTPSTIEHVEGTPVGKTYKDLFTYDPNIQPKDPLYVKADGTTICKVFLKRVTFTYKFYAGKSYSGALVSGGTITAKWDQNIWDQYKVVCKNMTSQSSEAFPWKVQSTSTSVEDFYKTVITNMGFSNDNFCKGDQTADGSCFIRYYSQNINSDWDIDENPNASVFQYMTGQSEPSNFDLVVSVKTGESMVTSSDEYINMYGFLTPNPLNVAIEEETDEYYGGPAIWIKNVSDGTQFLGKNKRGQTLWNGLKYFYKRNKNSLYLRNIHGVCDTNPNTGKPYHYDNCCAIASRDMSNPSATDGGVQYQYPLADLKFQITERQEPSSGEDGGLGITGITEDDSFMSFIPEVPDNVDEHYVFAGWYEDEAFENQVTSYNYKTGEHIVVNNWTMPNHQQDLYAKWIPPERQIAFYTATDPVLSVKNSVQYTENPSHLGEAAKVDYGSLIDNTDKLVFPSVDDRKDAFRGYRFVSWFYYKTAEDAHNDNPTYFDPTNMTMPWCDYSGPWPVQDKVQNYDEPVLQLFELWLPESQLYYQVNYVIKGAEGQPDTVVADPTIGKGGIGERIEAIAKDPHDPDSRDTFLYKYRGILDYAADEPTDHKKEITLSIESDNVITFYYQLDNTKEYKYQIYLVVSDPFNPDNPPQYIRKGEEYFSTFDNSAYAMSSEYPLEPGDIPSSWEDPDYTHYKLKSPNKQTINLIHDPDFTKYENCILFYYTFDREDVTKKFKYSIFTAKSEEELTTPRPDGLNGGAILNESQGYKHVAELEHNVLDGQTYEYVLIMPSPGFKFVKWQVKNPATAEAWTDVPETQWSHFDDGSIRLLCAKDEPSGKFENDRAYQAIFVEADNVSISYNAVTVNSELEDVDYTCGKITTEGTTTNFNPVYKEQTDLPSLQTATPHKLNDFQYFNFVGWFIKNTEGKFVKVDGSPTTLSAWNPSPSTATDVNNVPYYYYEGGDYYALFDESEVPITYIVNPSGTGTLSSISENVMPHAENATGSTATAATHYQFVNWTSDEAGAQQVCDTAKYVPVKTTHDTDGDWFEPGTYYAQFKDAEYEVTFECGENGSITSDPVMSPPYVYTVSDDAKVTVSSDALSANIKSSFSSVDSTITASPDDYYIVDYWSYKVADGEEQIFSGEYTVESDVTIKVAFKNITDLSLTFKVHNYNSTQLDPGKINVGDPDLKTEYEIKIPITKQADIPKVKFDNSNNSLIVTTPQLTDAFSAIAVPDDTHSRFVKWTRSEVKEIKNEIQYSEGEEVSVNTNHVFTAYFESLHDVNVIASEGGKIDSPSSAINGIRENAKLVYTPENSSTNIPEIDVMFEGIPIEEDHIKASALPDCCFTGWTYKDSKSSQPDVAVPFPDEGIELLRSVGDITLIANFDVPVPPVPDPGGEIINAQTGDSSFVYVLAGIAFASIAVFVLRRRKSNKA